MHVQPTRSGRPARRGGPHRRGCVVSDADHPNGGRSGAEVAGELRELAVQHAVTLVIALARMVRGKALEDYEEDADRCGCESRARDDQRTASHRHGGAAGGGRSRTPNCCTSPRLGVRRNTAAARAVSCRRSARSCTGRWVSCSTGRRRSRSAWTRRAVSAWTCRVCAARTTRSSPASCSPLGHGFAAIDAQWELHKAALPPSATRSSWAMSCGSDGAGSGHGGRWSTSVPHEPHRGCRAGHGDPLRRTR